MKAQKITITDYTNANHTHASSSQGGTVVGTINGVLKADGAGNISVAAINDMPNSDESDFALATSYLNY